MRNDPILNVFLICASIYTLFLIKFSVAVDTITPSSSIKDGETIVSAEEQFELGFFSVGDSKDRYVGIWYKKIQTPTVVWVANRNTPITDSSGVLKITKGSLELVDQAASLIWSPNVTEVSNPVAQLMDTGNFVIRQQGNNDPKDYLWQSFDYPTDTLLPGMKLGWDLKSGLDRSLASWKTATDPSTGDYSLGINRHGFPQGFISNKLVPYSRTGSWNGQQFTGVPQINQSFLFSSSYKSNEDELYYTFSVKNDSIYSRLVLNQTGLIQRLTWLEKAQLWNLFWYFPKDPCDGYNVCGAYGICSVKDLQICTCLTGFGPKDPQDWYFRDGSGGCIQKIKYECQKNDGFLQLKNVKIPDSSRSFVDSGMTLVECEAECRRNCSCKAYTSFDISNGGSGCIMWVDDLLDLREYNIGGQDLYVRVAASLLGDGGKKDTTISSDKKKSITLVVTLTVIPTIFLLMMGFCLASRKKKMKNMPMTIIGRVHEEKTQEQPLFNVVKSGTRDYSGESKDDLDLPLFDLCTMETATYNFSNANKLGEGGFGCVYKGTLENGQHIAVKRLSKSSTQGVEEFKNEVLVIARLQHRNLVRLLGCCFEGEERILVYEYMENKSLDSIVFDKSNKLNWQKRFNIILGIARGLLYLHQDSRFRIIHRDLKASNILLDVEMDPKISDFGMARIFRSDQTEENTMRVVGTYGYMSPEYAMDGLFSIKSDVFSFGVLTLEIVSGTKNRGFYSSNDQLNLLGQAWKLWREGRGLELMDTSIRDSCQPSEVLRCIQVGLLCVQERADERPNMATVLLTLSTETTTIPQPKQPGFSSGLLETETSSSNSELYNSNKFTVTTVEGR